MGVDTNEGYDRANPLGGPAFPVSIPGCGDNGWHGISTRDYFAAAALPALIDKWSGQSMPKTSTFARLSYEVADAMLAARGSTLTGNDSGAA